ncbi:hypothetical protein GCM10027169_24020 [Gordonia jinhuaensis]|uniref:SCP-2 sterol transfer family protein n=1 Tax=Gordonia jinhuaensis TaxID=1517702 RepID=A0A916WYR0_9ACTN|nr:hypothetical protein [Gordonia jinhuaensis]GGB40416.1 hypothetical protein GCM10011489_29990 [Gordonia jinhuaensis]
MIVGTDESVTASVNAEAVLGTLPELARRVPEARELLGLLDRPVELTFAIRGRAPVSFTFTSTQIQGGKTGIGSTTHVALLLSSDRHFNKMMAGQAQPVPLAGPRGIRFLTQVFTPLTDLLGEYLRPTAAALADDDFRQVSTLLTLTTVAGAVVAVANNDRSGRFSADQMPDGRIDLEVGDDLRYQIDVTDHHFTLVTGDLQTPRAALRFADLDTAGAVLRGEISSMECMSDSRLAMRGMISMVDNLNRILDRVGAYLTD